MMQSWDAEKIPGLHQVGSLVLSILLAVTIGTFHIFEEIATFDHNSQMRQEAEIAQKKNELFDIVSVIDDYVIVNNSQFDENIISYLKENSDNTFHIVENIYAKLSAIPVGPEVVKAVIIDTLRQLRFHDDEARYFIYGEVGTGILSPILLENGGKSLPDGMDENGAAIVPELVRIARSPAQQGLVRYRWPAPQNRTQIAAELTYVRLFQPYGWVIGTGGDITAIRSRRRDRVTDWLRAVQLQGNAYAFTLAENGALLAFSAHDNRGANIADWTRTADDTVRKDLIDLGRQGGGFRTFNGSDPATGRITPQLVYVTGLRDAGWTLGAGISLDDGANSRAAEQAVLRHDIIYRVGVTALILVVALWAAVLASRSDASWMRRCILRDRAELRRGGEDFDLVKFIVDRATDLVLVTDDRRRLLYANPAAHRQLEQSRDGVAGQADHLLAPLDPAVFRDSEHQRYETTATGPNGEDFALEIEINRLRYRGKLFYCAIGRDISERKAAEEQVRHRAEHDPLTDLPNRALMRQRLVQTTNAAGACGLHVAVLYLDLDHFKLVNDTLGHAAGDDLLRQVGARLKALVRARDTVSRLGGDEFVIVLYDLETPDQVVPIAAAIIEAVSAPLVIRDAAVTITPSIGISMFPGDGTDIDTLLHLADAALYRAKASGRNQYQFYRAGLTPIVTAAAGPPRVTTVGDVAPGPSVPPATDHPANSGGDNVP
ncbi:MAG: diguanylate cyclase [Azospirillaceae bacterium]|nr:diguanylate cyclase [Azospirillaceae bacterium]